MYSIMESFKYSEMYVPSRKQCDVSDSKSVLNRNSKFKTSSAVVGLSEIGSNLPSITIEDPTHTAGAVAMPAGLESSDKTLPPEKPRQLPWLPPAVEAKIAGTAGAVIPCSARLTELVEE